MKKALKGGDKMKGKNMSTLDKIAVILVIVGALNWGLDALNANLVEWLFGIGSTLTRVVYGLVGLSGLYKIYMMYKK